jgi:predicted GNAT family acetyltransferase
MTHTIVPKAIEGRGLLQQLVKYVLDYALERALK